MIPEEKQTLIEAMELGLECAIEVANDYHAKMAGYRQRTHDLYDADVKKIQDALELLKTL